MNDAIKNELALYEARLSELGFHPKSVNVYVRKLEEYLETNPQSLDADEDASAGAIGDYLDAAPVTYDDHARAASLRKWHLLRFGSQLGRRRLSVGTFATSPQIEAELGRLRARLESDGLTPAVVSAHCSVVAMFLGWLFPDGRVDPEAIDETAALEFLRAAKPHLMPSSAKVEATRIARYLRLLAEEDPTRPEGLPFAPACWGASSLPRAIGEDELAAILSAQSNPEVGSRNRAALLLMANMGLRCCEVVALTLDDVDFRNGTMHVRATKCQDGRRLPLDWETGIALADYVANHRPRSASRSVFLRSKHRRGEPVSLQQMRSSLRYQARLVRAKRF